MARDGHRKLNILTATARASVLLISLAISLHSQVSIAESRELDWGDLGVSLANPKNSYNGASNNLRILISPQRRMTRYSEADSSNYSQPALGQNEGPFTSLSSGSSYATPGQSAAYTALSASLASLKSRLNARGVSLAGRVPETGIQSYSSATSGTYSDSSRQQAQPNYISVTNPHEQATYTSGSHETHSNENKTIVLAIPAKINFLTDGSTKQGRSQQQQLTIQAPQHHQLTSIQTSLNSDRPEYVRHYGLINGAENADQARDVNSDHDHQLVIVNTPTSSSAANEQSQAQGTYNSGPPHTFSTVYYQSPGSLPLKYIQAQQPNAQSEVYQASGEEVSEEPHYESCLDTCNSADPRWRKFTVSKYKYCCSHSSHYDSQFEAPHMDKLSDANRQVEDAYYSYLHRKARGRRQRKSLRGSRSHVRNYPSRASGEEQSAEMVSLPIRPGRSSYAEYPLAKHYKSRYVPHDSEVQESSAGKKYGLKEKPYRYGRGREPEVLAVHYEQASDEEESPRVSSNGYGNSEYSVDGSSYAGETRPTNPVDEEDGRSVQEEGHSLSKNGPSSDGNSEFPVNNESSEESDPETVQTYKYSAKRRKKYLSKSRSRKSGKDGEGKRNRKSKTGKTEYTSGRSNSSEYEPAQYDEQYRPDTTTTFDEEPYSKDSENPSMDGGDSEKESSGNKYKSSLNESAIVNLSKTTMHLKEILSILEKKTQVKANETGFGTTPAPMTTTNSYTSLLFSSHLTNPSLSGLDFLPTEQGLKSAYKEIALGSSLGLPPYSKLSLDSLGSIPGYGSSQLNLKNAYKDTASALGSGLALSAYGTKLSPDPFGQFSGYGPSQMSLPSTKYLAYAASHPGRKRRIPRNPRYGQMMLPKTHLPSTTLLRPGVTRSPFTSAGLYHTLQYPSWYTRPSAMAATSSYPFRNLYRTTWFQ